MRTCLALLLGGLCLLAQPLDVFSPAFADEDPGPEKPPIVEKDQPAAPAPKAKADADDGIELIDAGAEPRRLLRYKFSEDKRDLAKVRLTMGTDVGGAAGGFAMPAFTTDVEVTWRNVTKDGADVHVKYVDVEVESDDGEMASTMKPLLEAMKGLELVLPIDPRGKPRGEPRVNGATAFGALGGAGGTSSMFDQLGQQQVFLPRVKLGVGARWKATALSPVAGGGPVMKVVAHFKIEAMDGDKITVSGTGKLTMADKQTLEQEVARHVRAAVIDSTGEMDFRQVLDLQRPAPSSVRLTMRMETTSEVDLGLDDEAPQRVHVNMTFKMSGTSKPLPDAKPVTTKASGPSDD